MDKKISSPALYRSFIEIEKTLLVATEWLLNDANFEMLQNNRDLFKSMLSKVGSISSGDLKKLFRNFEQELTAGEVPSNIAYEVAKVRFSKPVFDLFEIVVKESLSIETLIKNYYLASEYLKFNILNSKIKTIKPNDHWDNMSKDNLLKKIKLLQKKFAHKLTLDNNWFKKILKDEQLFFANYFNFIESLEQGVSYTLIPYNVILESLDKIVQL